MFLTLRRDHDANTKLGNLQGLKTLPEVNIDIGGMITSREPKDVLKEKPMNQNRKGKVLSVENSL